MRTKMVIEFDDKSHLLRYRQQRDAQVNKICKQANLPIVHIVPKDNFEAIRSRILSNI